MHQVDTVVLSWRSKPLKLYELLNLSREDDKRRLDSIPQMEQAIGLYLQKAFAEAEAAFGRLEAGNPSDRIARLYRDRCQSRH